MKKIVKNLRNLILAAACVLPVLAETPAFASDASDVKAKIEKFVSDLNKGDMKSVISARAPHTAAIDGFPPYAWQTCADWIRGYEANNKAIQGTLVCFRSANPFTRN